MNSVNTKYQIAHNAQNNTIIISGYIGAWDENLQDIAAKIEQSEGQDVKLIINSGGGSVFEGMGMAAFIKDTDKSIHTHVMGFAGSIASIIAISGDSTSITEGSMLMIHRATLGTWGESEDLRKDADLLEKIDSILADYYVSIIANNGKLIAGSKERTRKQVFDWMKEETFFTAREAVDNGFIQNYIERENSSEERAAAQLGGQLLAQINAPDKIIQKYTKIANMANTEKKEDWTKIFSNFFQGAGKEQEEPVKEEEPVEDKTTADTQKIVNEKVFEMIKIFGEALAKQSEKITQLENQLAEQAAAPVHGGISNKSDSEASIVKGYEDLGKALFKLK